MPWPAREACAAQVFKRERSSPDETPNCKPHSVYLNTSEALAPVEAKTQEAVVAVLAAKRIEADGPQQPFPASPTPRPPNLPAQAPRAPSPGHRPNRIS